MNDLLQPPALYGVVFAVFYGLATLGQMAWARRETIKGWFAAPKDQRPAGPNAKPGVVDYDSNEDVIDVSLAVARLRRHFVETKQMQRVVILDAYLIPGVFGTPETPAKDAPRIVTTVETEEA
jgi:hypothetical protein